jgi:hypothetical protein
VELRRAAKALLQPQAAAPTAASEQPSSFNGNSGPGGAGQLPPPPIVGLSARAPEKNEGGTPSILREEVKPRHDEDGTEGGGGFRVGDEMPRVDVEVGARLGEGAFKVGKGGRGGV